MPQHPAFAKIAAGSLLRVPLDALEAVFHRRSGMTHLLVDPAPALLDILEADGATLPQILERLAGDYELVIEDDEGASLEQVVTARLDELAGLGLISFARNV